MMADNDISIRTQLYSRHVLAFVEPGVGVELEGAVVLLLALLKEHRHAHPDGKSKLCVTKSAN